MEVEAKETHCRPIDVFLYKTKWDQSFAKNSYYDKEKNKKSRGRWRACTVTMNDDQ